MRARSPAQLFDRAAPFLRRRSAFRGRMFSVSWRGAFLGVCPHVRPVRSASRARPRGSAPACDARGCRSEARRPHVMRLPARLPQPVLDFVGSDDAPTLKRSSTAVDTLLTFCPPGPEARTKRSSMSFSSSTIVHANIAPSAEQYVGSGFCRTVRGVMTKHVGRILASLFVAATFSACASAEPAAPCGSGFHRHHRFADGGAEMGADGAAAAGRERAGGARVLPEIFRRPRVSAVLRALGRERRPGRRVRELQLTGPSCTRSARATRSFRCI